ncbi:MAG: hypothetical protein JST75_03815 [Bacteroidetes bacterium]|nr:hypothetical protein [Bacteroidota bacterium]
MAVAFFRSLKNAEKTHIVDVRVKPSGIGPDGGTDILVDFILSDYINQFTRTWVIQCKFHNEPISPKKISEINIPTLIHSNNACGYLLICKSRPTTSLTKLFQNLKEQTMHFQYKYEIWSGEEFKNKLILGHPSIHQQFFPQYFEGLKKVESEIIK